MMSFEFYKAYGFKKWNINRQINEQQDELCPEIEICTVREIMW